MITILITDSFKKELSLHYLVTCQLLSEKNTHCKMFISVS